MIHIKRINEMVGLSKNEFDEYPMLGKPEYDKMFLQVTIGWGYNDQYTFLVWADNYEDALYKIMVYYEKKNGKVIRTLSDMARNAIQELNDIDNEKEGREFETEEDWDAYYTIATGDKQDYYLISEFTSIDEIDDDYKQYILNGGRHNNANDIIL